MADFFSFFTSDNGNEEDSAGAKRLAIVAKEEGVGLASANCWLVCELMEARPPRASTESDLRVVSSVPAGAGAGTLEVGGA